MSEEGERAGNRVVGKADDDDEIGRRERERDTGNENDQLVDQESV